MSELKLRPEVKQTWLTALRSKEYEQATNNLKIQDLNGQVKHCCLGVLCDLAVSDGVEVEAASAPSALQGGNRIFSFDGEEGTLPRSVQEWAWGSVNTLTGLDPADPVVRHTDEQDDGPHDSESSLASLNDDGYSFRQIADLIEAQL